jgi:zinc metalloprotease ZmpB
VAEIDHSYLIRFDNNVGQRNVEPILMAPGAMAMASVSMHGVDRDGLHRLIVDAAELPADTRVRVRIATSLVGAGSTDMETTSTGDRYTVLGLSGASIGEVRGFRLQPSQRSVVQVTVDFSHEAQHGHMYPLTIRQLLDGEMVGAYTLELTAVKELDDYFFGNPRSFELHVTTCPLWEKLNRPRLKTFATAADALARGYNGCRFCLSEIDTD